MDASASVAQRAMSKASWRIHSPARAWLPLFLSGSTKRQLRGDADERRPEVQRHRLRLRQRLLLPHLCAARNSVRDGDAANWRAPLDRPYHGQLGTHLGSDDVHPYPGPILRHAAAAGGRRSGFLADLFVLPRELVPGRLPRSGGQPLLLLFRSYRNCRRRPVSLAARSRWVGRPARVAVAIPH